MLFALARLCKAEPKFNLSPQKNANWNLAEASFGIEELMFKFDRLTKIYLSLENIFRA